MPADSPTLEVRVAELSTDLKYVAQTLGNLDRKLDALLPRREWMEMNERRETEIADLKAEIKALKSDVATIKEMATRWKGGFIVLAALGAIIGWISAIWDKVTRLWH